MEINDPKFLFDTAVNELGGLDAVKGQDLSPAFVMLQVQMLIAENFDDQMRDMADKIKFLKDVVSTYRKNQSHVQKFLAQTTHTSNNDNKQVIIATPDTMQKLMGALTEVSYDVETKTMETRGMQLIDFDEAHDVNDESAIGMADTLEFQEYFSEFASLESEVPYNQETREARHFPKRQHAAKIGNDSKLQLPFYHDAKHDKDANGDPTFSVYVDQIDKMLDQINTLIQEVELEVEDLASDLTELSEKRKAALDGANQMVRKMNEAQTNTVSKL